MIQSINIKKIKSAILRKYNLKLIKNFDTNEHELDKDVFLAKNKKSEYVVVRIGERRPANFFPNGYNGKHFKIPKLYYCNPPIKTNIDKKHNISFYEIEEYLEGNLIFDICSEEKSAKKPLPDNLLKKILQTYWEFYIAVSEKALPNNWDVNKKLIKHFEKGKILMRDSEKIKKLINDNMIFWNKRKPSKWKYSLDNLIMMPDGKIGFIDLFGAGKYFPHYDLGWIIWPMWFNFTSNELLKSKEHIKWIKNNFIPNIIKSAPQKNLINKKQCWLIIFERLVGSYYDVAEKITHVQEKIKDKEWTDLHIKFLNELMEEVIEGLSNI